MRVLYIVHQYFPEKTGGTELYTRSVAHALGQRGHQVAVFYRRDALGQGLTCYLEEGTYIYAVWDREAGAIRRFLLIFGNRFIQRSFAKVLEEFKPEVVHIQHLIGLPVFLIREIVPVCPTVITLHDFWWYCAAAHLLTVDSEEICSGPTFWNCARCMRARAGYPYLWPASPLLAGLAMWRNRLLKQVLDAASLLIAPTDFVRRWYVAHGVPEEKIAVLPPGLDAVSRPKISGRADGGVRFAYLGGLARQKGVHVLVEAFSEVRGNAELWIAGDESFDPAYVSRLRAMAGPRVRFLGRLDRQGVWDTLAQVDVVAVPSLWYETFSLLISEAFAMGLPVLASRLGALAERVRDGVDGLLLPPGDVSAWRAAIQRLIDEPDLLAHLRANVRPPMTMEEHVEKLEELYRKLGA